MILLPTPPPAAPAFIDKAKTLRAQSFLDNRDYDWYQANVPFFESPDQDVDATYYYLWELVTKHLVYGSPSSGYAFTEFIDRPGWSGTYGAISCAAGLQLYEVRWLRNPRYAQDYARYWFRTPGAQPYNYSTWLADSVWAVYKVGLDADFAKGLLPDLKEYFAEWTRRQFVPEVGLFWQTGMRDGMETNINSRQTVDWFAGAPGYRPTFNSYMFADARGIAAIARLAGETETASLYEKKAADLREKALSLMWDPQRQFFMHVFKNDERDGIKALTKTHETGKFAGSPYGRELIGYVPWQFEMADARFAGAWSFLMDPQRFFAPFGPTVTERNDPLFKISPRCCEWSGNSWPYATTQTLAAMANLLQGAPQRVVTNEQYFRLLKTYTMTQRKAGKPYIAESAHPDTGSWEGSDNYDHSEHYFHSNYNDLIITGLVGLRPRADDTVELRPLAPKAWDYFALEDVPYHGRKLAVVWDRDGKRYGRGKGLSVFADGKRIANSPNLGPLSAKLAPGKIVSPSRSINYAVNNEGTFFPRVAASSSDPKAPVGKAVDGNYWYLTSPPNRWASAAGSKTDWLSVNFGTPRSVREVRLYLLEDGPGGAVRAPRSYRLQSWEKGGWRDVPGQKRTPARPEGHRANVVRFDARPIEKLRVVFENAKGAASGLSEIEAWGDDKLPLSEPNAKIGNLAYNPSGQGYPRASASYTSRFDRVEEANDGKSFFSANSRNRWTSYESKNPTDWVEIDFGEEKSFDTVLLHLFGDEGGVQRPESYEIQYWDGSAWRLVENARKSPTVPVAGAMNTVAFRPVRASRVRVVLTPRPGGSVGLTEIEVWEKAILERG